MDNVGATKNFKRRMGTNRQSDSRVRLGKSVRRKNCARTRTSPEPHGNKGTKHTAESNLRSSFVEIEKTVFPVLQAELNKQLLTRQKFAQKLGFKVRA